MTAPPKPKCRARKRWGRCFELAGRIKLIDESGEPWTLVHGWVNWAPGMVTPHAWLEHPSGFVFDAVKDEMMPTADYCARYGARAVARYADRVEAARVLLAANHWGPWHPLLLKHCGGACRADDPGVTGETV